MRPSRGGGSCLNLNCVRNHPKVVQNIYWQNQVKRWSNFSLVNRCSNRIGLSLDPPLASAGSRLFGIANMLVKTMEVDLRRDE